MMVPFVVNGVTYSFEQEDWERIAMGLKDAPTPVLREIIRMKEAKIVELQKKLNWFANEQEDR